MYSRQYSRWPCDVSLKHRYLEKKRVWNFVHLLSSIVRRFVWNLHQCNRRQTTINLTVHMIVDLQYKCNRRQTTINLTVHMIVDLQYKCNRRQTTINQLTVHMIVDLQYKCNRSTISHVSFATLVL